MKFVSNNERVKEFSSETSEVFVSLNIDGGGKRKITLSDVQPKDPTFTLQFRV